MVEPIKPENVISLKKNTFPDYVLRAFNHCIALNFLDGDAKVMQEDVIKQMISEAGGDGEIIDRLVIFKRKYLDVEDIYRQAGWYVTYDKPSYCEDYEAFYVFEENNV